MSEPVIAPAREQAREPSPVVPLMILVLGLAVATMWFIVLPTLQKPPPPGRTCEVVFLTNGNTRCIERPESGMRPKRQAIQPLNHTPPARSALS